MKVSSFLLTLAAIGGSIGISIPAAGQDRAADIAGEIGTSTALLQARITPAQQQAAGITGVEGWARFEAADNEKFVRPVVSEWLMVKPENDFVVKFNLGKVRERYNELEGGTQYFWRVRYGLNQLKLIDGPVHTFKTLSGSLASRAVRIAVVQGIDVAAPGAAARIARVTSTKPDYVIFLGNSVSYDRPGPAATDAESMRAKWHALLAQPAMGELLGSAGSYWLKNDRDFRFEGADPAGDEKPSALLGASVFREQVPVVDPRDPASLTFRVEQPTRDLALWMLEVRDYRSANNAPDNKEKSLWGTSQAEWLQRALVNSTTPFKIVIQPTQILGPALPGSKDSHASMGGFRTERQAFLDHVKANKLGEKGLLILTGTDWQYHSVGEDGLGEISVGSLTSPLAGPVPSTDGSVKQPFSPAKAAAGFALIDVSPAAEGKPAKLTVSLVQSDTGEIVYTAEQSAAKR